ncbi:MAG TPA: hypothetical protein VH143_02310 [Kofleriaceae bacterium]|nr:hypothetical protein [Kofleriaceae bacterium]
MPRAVATGSAGNAAPDDRVSPRRAGIVAGVIAAAVAFAYWGVHDVPSQAVAAIGGHGNGVARYGGVVATWTPPPGLDFDQLRERLERRERHAELSRDGNAIHVELPGISEPNAADAIEMISAGGLEFHTVIESDSAQRLADTMMLRGSAGVEPMLETDTWRPDDGGRDHTDYYLYAHDRATLERTFAAGIAQGWAPPPDSEIVDERIEPAVGSKDPGVVWRSYFVSRKAELDGTSIANAIGSYDPITNRPNVLVDFDEAGAKQFGELTATIAGHKLAMTVGGVVKSAPVIEGAIRGGRAVITLGGSDPEREEHDRDVLVDVLRTGSLPLGGTFADAHWVAPTETGLARVAHVLVALLAGLLGFALAFLVIRATRPSRETIAPLPDGNGTHVWRRLAWTLAPVAVYFAGMMVSAPGINDAELVHAAMRRGSAGLVLSPFALGVAPLIFAFVIVEIVASVSPRLRPLRDTVLGRRTLGLAVAIAAAITSIVQAYFVCRYAQGVDNVVPPNNFWLAVATIAAGPMVLAVLASLISTRGVGNGYGVLLVAGWLWEVRWDAVAAMAKGALVFDALVIAAGVAVALAVLRWRVRAPGRVAIPLPASGNLPLYAGGGVLAALAALGALNVHLPRAFEATLHRLDTSALIAFAAMLAVTFAWSFAFARPGRRRAELAPMLEPADRASWLRAAALTAAVLAALFVLDRLREVDDFRRATSPTVVIIIVAVIVDAMADWNARETADLIAVWPLHDPLLVDAARERLDAAGIPHHVQSTRLRSLLWIAGSYVPMMVLVPVDRAEAAHVLLRDWLSSPSSNG